MRRLTVLLLLSLLFVSCDRSSEPIILGEQAANAETIEDLKHQMEEGDAREAAHALFSLTLLYEEKDSTKSRQYMEQLKRLAKSNENAQRLLVTALMMTGRHREAIPMLEKAANEGEAGAAYQLSSIYARGLRVEKDMKKAIHWRKIAARLGDEEAQEDLEHYRKQHLRHKHAMETEAEGAGE